MIAFGSGTCLFKMHEKQQLGSQLGTVCWLWSGATGESMRTMALDMSSTSSTMELLGHSVQILKSSLISILWIINCTVIIFPHWEDHNIDFACLAFFLKITVCILYWPRYKMSNNNNNKVIKNPFYAVLGPITSLQNILQTILQILDWLPILQPTIGFHLFHSISQVIFHYYGLLLRISWPGTSHEFVRQRRMVSSYSYTLFYKLGGIWCTSLKR